MISRSSTQRSGLQRSAVRDEREWKSPGARLVCLLGDVYAKAGSALVFALFAPWALCTHDKIRRLLLAVVALNIVFPAGVHLGDREDAEEFGALPGLSVALTTFALVCLYVPLLLGRRNRSEAAGGPHFGAPLVLYLAFAAVSLFAARDISLAVFELCLFIELFLLYFYIANEVTSSDEVLFMMRVVMIGLALEGLLMMALAAGVGEFNFLGIKTRVDELEVTGITRIGGTIGSPNDVAAYLQMALALTAGVLLARIRRAWRMLAILALAAGLVGLVLTMSRGAWTGFVVSLVIIGWFGLRGGQISWKIPAVAAALVVVCGVLFSSAISQRLFEEDNGAAHSRVPLMYLAGEMIADNPVIGVGANNFPVAMEPYLAPRYAGEFIYSVHNKYLLVWSETGIGGLLAFLWFLMATVRRGFRCWRNADPVLSPIALGCTAALCGHMFHMNVDVFRGRSIMQFVWLIAALLVVMERLVAAKRAAETGAVRSATTVSI
jgi:O-antigen ligase